MKVCAVEGCERPSKTRGWCAKHYERWLRHGDPMLVIERRPCSDPCSVHGCEKLVFCKGLCRFHDQRSRIGVPLEAPHRIGSCYICAHPASEVINVALLSMEPRPSIANRFGVGRGGLDKHMYKCLDFRPGRRDSSPLRQVERAAARLEAVQRYVSQSLT